MNEERLAEMIKGPDEDMFVLAARIIGENGIDYVKGFFIRHGEGITVAGSMWPFRIMRKQTINTADVVVRFDGFGIHLGAYGVWMGINIPNNLVFKKDVKIHENE